MKFFTYISILFIVTSLIAQNKNKSNLLDIPIQDKNWSTSFDLGLARAKGSFSPNYSSLDLSNFTASLGVRYMFDSRTEYKPFGIQLKGGFTNLTGDSNSEDFENNVYHITLNGVIKIKDVFKVGDRDWPNGFNLYGNLGVGGSHFFFPGEEDSIASLANDGYFLDGDDLVTLNFGIIPEYKISKDLTLHLDMTYVVFLSPHFTFDGYSKVRAVGVSDFDPKMFRASIGLTYYLLTR